MTQQLTLFTYGAVSSKYSVEAANKLTAYVAMVMHYDRQAHMIALYDPEELVKGDQWFSFDGKISERLDEIFMEYGNMTFDEYCETNVDAIKEAYKTIKQLV